MIRIFVAVIVLIASGLAYGSDAPLYKPFPEAQITELQWEGYRDMVLSAYGSSIRRFPDEHLEVLHSPDQVMHFAFTMPGHPAHPAWITRSVEDGAVNQIGYFAGEEPPFAELFEAYQALTDRTLKSVADKPGRP